MMACCCWSLTFCTPGKLPDPMPAVRFALGASHVRASTSTGPSPLSCHSAPIVCLLLKVTVNGMQQRDSRPLKLKELNSTEKSCLKLLNRAQQYVKRALKYVQSTQSSEKGPKGHDSTCQELQTAQSRCYLHTSGPNTGFALYVRSHTWTPRVPKMAQNLLEGPRRL